MAHGIRGRLILIFTGLAAGPVLVVGAALAWLSSRSAAPVPALTILALTGAAAAAAAGIGAALAMRVAGRMVRPLESLTEAAEAIVAGDLVPRALAVSDDELGILAGTFNHMARSLRDRIGTLEHRAAERTKTLAVFRDISRISTRPDEKRLAAEAAGRIKNAFNYYHVWIFFLDEAGGNLILAGGTGKESLSLAEDGYQLAKGDGPAGRAAESNTVVLVGDSAREGGGKMQSPLPKVKSELAIPIAADGEVLGVLDILQNITDGVSRADAELLQPIADQMAVSVRSARMLARAWQQAEQTDPITRIGRKIRQTAAVEDALRVAARELGRALGSGETRAVLFELPPAGPAADSGAGDGR